MPAARSNSQCPYCDHVSPVGSKFCNDCGAALHLRPCPHCGSVNDITQNTHCSRCNGDLGFVEKVEENAPVEKAAALEVPLLREEIESTPPQAAPEPEPAHAHAHAPMLATFPDDQFKARKSFAPLIGMVLIAVAAASYYGLRSVPEAGPNAAAQSARPLAVPLPAPAVAPAALAPSKAGTEQGAGVNPTPVANQAAGQAASAPAPTQALEAASMPAFAASLARLSPPGAGRSAQVRREAVFAPAAAAAGPEAERHSSSLRSRSPGEGLDLKQPQIGSCTDAVAALGLCAQESIPRRP